MSLTFEYDFNICRAEKLYSLKVLFVGVAK